MVDVLPRQAETRPANPLLPMHARRLDLRLNGKQLIDQVSFSLDGHHRTVILGPNGAGKSLLLRLVHGLLRPSSGSVTWAGLSPTQAGRRLAMVFQRSVMLRRSVAANVRHVLTVMGVPRAQRSERVQRTLSNAGLSALAECSARTLSGGEQQRLSIARAWALSPQVLLLDEPTSNLDPGATAEVEALIRAVEGSGTKIIMTTHDIAQARRLAGDVLFLHHGRLLEHTGAESFFQRPQTKEAAQFIRGELLR
jgi:tungstate transport system ATP-binding protein